MHCLRCPTVEDVIAGAVIEATRLAKLGRLTLYITFMMKYYCGTACGHFGFAVRVQSCFMLAYRISLPREILRSNAEFFVSENLPSRKNKRSF